VRQELVASPPADATAQTAPLLELEGVCSGYGRIQVLWGVSLTVYRGEAVALLGANGAGKTTLLRTIVGQLPLWDGALRFEGRDVAHLPPHRRVAAGMAMAPEGRQLFAGMTVWENLLMGAYARTDGPAAIERDLEWVETLFPRLKERRHQLAGTLSGGEQQMCAVGRALMARPRLLLIDELSLGLAPVVVDRLIEALQAVRRAGVTLLLVEQDVENALTLAERGYVLESGRITLAGTREALLHDPQVREAFIGI
jgi:branched-chain amino acid transport system ATP-binding protein